MPPLSAEYCASSGLRAIISSGGVHFGHFCRHWMTPVPCQAKPSRPLAQDGESKKIRALWLFLHELGAVKNPSEEALATYVKRIAGVDALQWISGEQAERLIETMKKWAMRFLPQAVKALVPQVGALQLSDLERGQLNAVLNKAFARQTFDPMHSAWESLNDVLKRGR